LAQFPAPTPIDIDTYFTLLRSRSPKTRYNYAGAIRGFLKFCQQRGCRVEQLLDCLPQVKVVARRREAAPIESVAAVLSLKNLKPRTRALLYILISSGPRISEVLSLKRSDVDLKGLRITVLGKGGKERTIPITRPTALAIREYLATTRKSSYLFPGKKSLTWHVHCVQDHLKRLCHQAKVDPFTPHQLRHLTATQLIMTGANPKSVSEILGHKDPGITLRVYTHATEEINRREHRAHDPLAQVLSQVRQPRGRPRSKERRREKSD
jgi:integrase